MLFQTKQYNTRHAFKATLYEPNSSPVDLTGCEVLFCMQNDTHEDVVNRAMQIGDNGEALLVFHSEEVANHGTFYAEITVIYPDGRREIYPHSGYVRVYIQKSLGGESNGL